MLITTENVTCSKCRRKLARYEVKRLYVETDNYGNAKIVCTQCKDRK